MPHSLHSYYVQFSAKNPQTKNYHVVFMFAGVLLNVDKVIS